MKYVLDPSLKLALFASTPFLNYQNNLKDRNTTFLTCKEQFLMIPVVLYFRKNHYLVKEVNEKISMINSAGLSDYWTKVYLERTLKNDNNGHLQKLNIHQLFGSIQIWFGGCIIGLVTFIVEYICFIMKR